MSWQMSALTTMLPGNQGEWSSSNDSSGQMLIKHRPGFKCDIETRFRFRTQLIGLNTNLTGAKMNTLACGWISYEKRF